MKVTAMSTGKTNLVPEQQSCREYDLRTIDQTGVISP